MTRCHRLGGLHNGTVFITAPEAGTSQIRVSAGSRSGESSPSGLQRAAFLLYPHKEERERETAHSLVSPCEDTNSTMALHLLIQLPLVVISFK